MYRQVLKFLNQMKEEKKLQWVVDNTKFIKEHGEEYSFTYDYLYKVVNHDLPYGFRNPGNHQVQAIYNLMQEINWKG